MASEETPSSSFMTDNLVVNWVKLGLAVQETKQGLQKIAEDEINEFASTIFNEVRKEQNIPSNIVCRSCTNETLKLKRFSRVKRTQPFCSKKLCHNVCKKVESSHRYGQPNWKNTKVSLWSTSCWEIAKCFMPDGYSSKISAEQTDFNGVVNFLINLLPFEKKVSTDFKQQPNIFTWAREVGKDFRHNEKCRVTDSELDNSIQKLTDVLKEPKYIFKNIEAQNALKRIEELSKSTWVLDSEKTLKLIKQEIDDSKEELTQEKHTILENLKQRVDEMIQKGIDAIENKTKTGIKRIHSEAEEITKKIKREQFEDYEILKTELKNRLVTDIKETCWTVSVSPFLTEEETFLLKIFVDPILQIREHHLVKENTHTECFKEMFYKNRIPCRRIYLTGDAGVGKTLFCKRMALLWALAHSRIGTRISKKDKRDMTTIKLFEFLFFVNLRETTQCEIEDIIHSQLGYDKSFLQRVLQEEECLIVLDGLHEWSHKPSCTEFGKIKTPHSRNYKNCTFITTSRPYKLETLRLKGSEIDREIVITGMDPDSQIEFASKIVRSFSKKKDPEEFLTYMETYNMSNLLEIPSAAALLVCLWIDNKLDNYSHFELYGTMMDHMLQRADEKYSSITEHLKDPDIDIKMLPKCLMRFKNIRKHFHKLKKLFHLAFETLLLKDGNSVSYAKDDMAKYGLTNEEIEDLCVIGIFSKRKAVGYLTERRYKISFFHVCFQEYMAALYIKMNEDKFEEVKKKIIEFCRTYDDVERLANIFITLASVDANIVAILFSKVAESVAFDELAIAFREFSCTSMYNFVSNRKQQIEEKIKSLQNLAIKCYSSDREAFSKTIGLRVNDIFIYKTDSTLDDVAYLLKINGKSLRSVSISGWSDKLTFDSEASGNIQRIEIRYIEFESEFDKIIALMRKSMTSLQNVFIHYCSIFQMIPIKELPHLRSLYLETIKMSHVNLQKLVSYLSAEKRLSQIGLENVKCTDHESSQFNKCNAGKLDLSKHREMHLLGLSDICISEVIINSDVLERLRLDCKHGRNKNWITKLLNTLQHASILKKIVILEADSIEVVGQLVKTISTLKKLKYMYLLKIDFHHYVLEIKSDVQELEIELSHFKMSHKAFNGFLRSISKRCKNTVTCVHLFFFEICSDNNTPMLNHDLAKLITRYDIFQIYCLTDVCIKFRIGMQERTPRKTSECDL